MSRHRITIVAILAVLAVIAWGLVASLAFSPPGHRSTELSENEPALADASDDVLRAYNEETGNVGFVGSTDGAPLPTPEVDPQNDDPVEQGIAILEAYGPEFGLQNAEENLAVNRVYQPEDGRAMVRYQQTYNDVPVLAGELIVNTDRQGNLQSISGEVSDVVTAVDTDPEATAADARTTALETVAKTYGLSADDFTATEPELWIFDERLLRPSERPAELVWRMDVSAIDLLPIRELVLVNAHTGGVSLHFNQIDTAWTTAPTWPAPQPNPNPIPPAATVITVDTTVDDNTVNGNCTLREAIIAANTDTTVDTCPAGTGDDTIDLPAGTYTLSIPGTGEDASATGDLDIAGNLEISGVDAASTIIDGGALDRVFHVVGAHTVTLSDVTIQNGQTQGTSYNLQGGGILNATGASLTLNNSVVQSNLAISDGGGIATSQDSTLTLNNTYVAQNAAIGSNSSGGGVYGYSMTAVNVADSSVSDNLAEGAGGGLFANGDSSSIITLTNVTVRNNYSLHGGGGIHVKGHSTLQDVAVIGNTSLNQGGGIYASLYVYINNSTIANNTALAEGGGIYKSGTHEGLFSNVTISNNTASEAGGLYLRGDVDLKNTLLAGNEADTAPDCSGDTIASTGYNLIDNTSGCSFTTTTGDQTDVDALTGPTVQALGIVPLASSSPAVNGGNPSGCTDHTGAPIDFDQRGQARVGICDIGAFEYVTPGAAASVIVSSGSPQRTLVGAAFPLPLEAGVVDLDGNVVSGATVDFTAPGSPPSGTFGDTGTGTTSAISGADGKAAASTFTADNNWGQYAVAATVSGIPDPAIFNLTNGPWLVANGGSDSNDCSAPATPCASINGVLDKDDFILGDLVYVAEGTYTQEGGSGAVVYIDKNITLLGGWDAATFTTQSGMSVIDGQDALDGIVVKPDVTSVVIERFELTRGGGPEGKGLLSYPDSAVTMTDCLITGNTISGGIRNYGTLALTDCTVSGNRNGIFTDGDATLNNVTISDNNGVSGVGLLVSGGGTVTLNDSTVSNNIGTDDGGGILVRQSGALTVNRSAISNNSASNRGGGIYAAGSSLTVSDSTIDGNSASQKGGGIFATGGTNTLSNTTISGNTGGRGGGIFGDFIAVVSLNNVTITANHADDAGGGIYQDYLGYATINMSNTIVAANTATSSANDCDNTIISVGYNLIGDGTYCLFTPTTGDIIGSVASPIDPFLGPLQDNGGPTLTHALLDASPAVDNGNPATPGNGGDACEATDQRGVTRPDGPTCDMGAYEGGLPYAGSEKIETYDAENGTSLPGTFLCGHFQQPCTGGADPHADGAHQYARDTYYFYLTHHGRDSIDDAGMTIVSSVHYASDYLNAFWNGEQMVYGDAAGFPLADDVVGHELTHGVTDYTSGLFYYYQSGAISESLSDLWGEFVDLTNGAGDDSPAVRWLMGEDITGEGAGRDMADPPAFDDPDRMTSPLYYSDSGDRGNPDHDNGGVHTNSGVNNKAAYLMTDGGTFNGYVVDPLGIDKVAAIYYEAQTGLLTSGADYHDLYEALYRACLNLVGGPEGITPDDCQEVRDATDAVEMNLEPVPNYNPDPDLCPAGLVPYAMFYDDLESGDANWDYGVETGESAWVWTDGYAHSGSNMLWGQDYHALSDSYAAMNLDVPLAAGSQPYLHFAHSFAFEDPDWDGGLLQYSTDGGSSWYDGDFLNDAGLGYNGTIYNGEFATNPNAGSPAFVSDSHGYVGSRYDLSSLAGGNVRFRWHVTTDEIAYDWGWFLDDVQIYTCTSGPVPVNSVADTDDGVCEAAPGDCTLREAINVANVVPGTDNILFDILGPTPYTITPASELPTITDPVIIDGTSQSGYAGTPIIELDGLKGAGGPAGANGLVIVAADSEVSGLQIRNFEGHGVLISGTGATGNWIHGNEIGVNTDGVRIENGASSNTIGTNGDGISDLEERQYLTSNENGIAIVGAGSDNNIVAGNIIGKSLAGFFGGSLVNGVLIDDGAQSNRVGTNGDIISDDLERNIVVGAIGGVYITGVDTNNNIVAGNYVGVDTDGVTPLGNEVGVWVIGSNPELGTTASPQYNLIGTDGDGVADDAERNIISGNREGVTLAGPGADNNVIAGNFIGTDATGSIAVPNESQGALISDGAQFNLIGTDGDGLADTAEGNVISGNDGSGITIFGSPGGSTTDDNVIAGNHIGVNAAGDAALPNGGYGVEINGAQSTRIGTDGDGVADADERNVISGNRGSGILIANSFSLYSETCDNVVAGNYIGTDAAGTSAIPNFLDGVTIDSAAHSNLIGTDGDGVADAAERNVISGNLSCAQIIGETCAASSGGGIFIHGSHFNVVAGNYIGTDANGNSALPNSDAGIRIVGPANLVGTNDDGLADTDERNVISGNISAAVYITGDAVENNIVAGNYIGTDVSGDNPLGNAAGIFILDGAANNVIGGTTPARGNLISSNTGPGVGIGANGTPATNNVVQGNQIGGTASHTYPPYLGNSGNGVHISEATGNTIGGTVPGAGNIIILNGEAGVFMTSSASGNLVQGNFIGTDDSPWVGGIPNLLPNSTMGVHIESGDNNTIGGTESGAGNIILDGYSDGTVVIEAGVNNAILSNTHVNGSGVAISIDLGRDGVTPNDPDDPDGGPNNLQNFPVLTASVSDGFWTMIEGSLDSAADTTYRLEFFASTDCPPSGSGSIGTYLDYQDVTTDSNGDASFAISLGTGTPAGQYITATATDPDGNTSEFSACQEVVLSVCYSLAVDSNDPDWGSVDVDLPPNCFDTQYLAGTTVSLTANANPSYSFVDWNGDASGSDNPLDVTMDADKQITANFIPGVCIGPSDWQVEFSMAGGMQGKGQSLTLSSSGEYTAYDGDGDPQTGTASPDDLNEMQSLLETACPFDPEQGRPAPCASCFRYGLDIDMEEQRFVYMTNDAGPMTSPLRSLIEELRGFLQQALNP